ncbi:hypothetical protein JCM8547_000146 [Rhodosporidiobolus lusitaniae]
MRSLEQRLRWDVLSPLVTAAFLACISCGVVVTLASIYFIRFSRDRVWFRILVGVLTLLVIVDTVIQAHYAFSWAVLNFGDYEVFSKTAWQQTGYCFSGIPVFIVQIWFAWRLWVSSERGKVAGGLVGLIVAGAVSGMGCILHTAVVSAQSRTLTEMRAARPTIAAWTALMVFVDVLITAGHLYYLVYLPHRSSSGLLKPDSRITNIALLLVKTGSVALITQLLILVLFFAYPNAYHFGTVAFLESKIYVSSLIISLNARDRTAPSTSSGGGATYPDWALALSRPHTPRIAVVAAAEEGRSIPLILRTAPGGEDGKEEEEVEVKQRGFETKLSRGRSSELNATRPLWGHGRNRSEDGRTSPSFLVVEVDGGGRGAGSE